MAQVKAHVLRTLSKADLEKQLKELKLEVCDLDAELVLPFVIGAVCGGAFLVHSRSTNLSPTLSPATAVVAPGCQGDWRCCIQAVQDVSSPPRANRTCAFAREA